MLLLLRPAVPTDSAPNHLAQPDPRGAAQPLLIFWFGCVQDFEKLKQTAKHMPALTQSELSVSFHDDETIAYCAKHGIVYQAYSP